jgi:ubiquinone/menaquinone biosynthesis C-methylase UbiE
MSVDYDAIAAAYESRYERSDYAGVETALASFIATKSDARREVLEVGCGTGYWLRFLHRVDYDAVGIDPSQRMLAEARARAPALRLVRARAEALPFGAESFDRIFCVNALHHFEDRAVFFEQARRLLRPGGALLTIGLDPHTGLDQWWIYDYFPSALALDRKRYPCTADVKQLLTRAGFDSCEVREIQRFSGGLDVADAARRGFLNRTGTSQLMVISEAEYDEGVKRIHAESEAHPDRKLLVDLRLYATIGRVR